MAQTTDLSKKVENAKIKDTEENSTRINVAELEAVAPDDTVNKN